MAMLPALSRWPLEKYDDLSAVLARRQQNTALVESYQLPATVPYVFSRLYQTSPHLSGVGTCTTAKEVDLFGTGIDLAEFMNRWVAGWKQKIAPNPVTFVVGDILVCYVEAHEWG
ncbi:hypothetical protein AC579_8036 [Pseudocercospora musae]|uniref:Uncharacterized protein n=1 Tax=Pseudocercospora musae TaxID=113226 RepID=A0A139IPG6_9PEZI|nr:hypothetical protein AC579_8036 [Pseudocercospora musae]